MQHVRAHRGKREEERERARPQDRERRRRVRRDDALRDRDDDEPGEELRTAGAGDALRMTGGAAAGEGAVVAASACSSTVGTEGTRHLPSLFCAHMTVGFTSETSLITSSCANRDMNRMRNRKVSA